MMWILRNEDKGLIFRVNPGKQNVVSRKEGDLLLLGDQSISRKHAELAVQSENENTGIVLKDLSSKYGTFIVCGGGELTQVSPNEQVTLNHGDSVRFGIQWNMWRVEFFPLVVATSTLSTGEKSEVKEMVSALGGEVLNDWQPCCTHLTMNKLTVTVKVVCALACGKPIVVPGYWKVLKEALATTQTKLPDYKDFVPPLAEALLNPYEVSFTSNPERGKLFSGYTFVAASSRQLTRIKSMITAASGNAVEFNASLWTESKLMQDKTVLMQHSPADKQGSQQSQVHDGYIAAARKLKAAGVRCVPESEIGLSILYCSMDKYCNPRFSAQSLFGASASQSTQQITVNCPNTQEFVKPSCNGVKSGPTSCHKRTHEDSFEEEQNPSKRTNSGVHSEDMFSSPNVESKVGGNSVMTSSSLKKSGQEGKKSVVDPSLDMFAASGQCIQNKKEKPPIVNPSLDMFAISGQSDQNKKENSRIINPSLDMFATSGQISNKENKNNLGPSCQDIFASNESRQTLTKRRNNCNESSSSSNKQQRIVDEENDEFSFTTNKNNTKSNKTGIEKQDEFSFSSRRSNRQHLIDEDDGDEFSFSSNKKSNHQKAVEEQNDEFSFVSSKSSKKRNRQNNPDTFGSNAECSTSNSRAGEYQSKVKNNCGKTLDEVDQENDDLFAFAEGPAPKRKKNRESSFNSDEPDAEVKLALLSKKDSSDLLQHASEPVVFDEPPNDKDLVTYSKEKPCPVKIKEEVRDEEVDELAQELNNATIVVVKPLVVSRPQQRTEAQSTSNVKNFKKFRKITGMNKRIVPHIIGGSDLIPHYANCQNIDDVLPPSPPHQLPDDDWEFPNEKRKGKNR